MKKTLLRILREVILMTIVFIIVSGIGYQCSKTLEQRENDVRSLRTFLFSRYGIEWQYSLIEKDMEGPVLWDSATQKSDKQKYTRGAIIDWIGLDAESAVKNAETIFCGKVLERSTQTRGLGAFESNGEVEYSEVYRELTVEVTKMIKGDWFQKIILYKEPGGETEDYIYTYHNIDPLNIGQEYIFILDKYNTYLRPWTVIPIEDGMAKVSYIMCFENLLDENGKIPEQGITVEAYMKSLKQRVLVINAIKTMIYVVVIGITLVSCYFVCRNLYKTTRFVIMRIKGKNK